MKTDMELERNVLDELRFEPEVDAGEIGVAVKDGIVTLTGNVHTFFEKLAAERAVKGVSGVKGIAEEIHVNLPAFHKRTDADIARAAANALEWNTLVPNEKIKVTAENGLLTLEGEVDWQYEKKAAKDTVQTLAGVRGVLDQILVKPRLSPVDIKSDIISAFKRDAGLDAERVKVEVVEDEVLLNGRVRSFAESEEAERTAWAARGVTKVVNNLVVEY